MIMPTGFIGTSNEMRIGKIYTQYEHHKTYTDGFRFTIKYLK